MVVPAGLGIKGDESSFACFVVFLSTGKVSDVTAVQVVLSEETRVCTRCGPQPISAFGKDITKPNGLKTRCKACRRVTENDKPVAEVVLLVPEAEVKEVEIEMRICSQCGPQPASAFHRDSSKKDGYHTRCKSCRNQVAQNYRQVRSGRFHRVPVPTPHEEAVVAAKEQLCELFPTAYAKLVHSELLKRELVNTTPQPRYGWKSL